MHGQLLFKPCHGTNGTASSAFNAEREADKPEPSLAYQFVEIDESLHVGESHVAADMVNFKVGAAEPAWTDGFNSKQGNLFLSQPDGTFLD